MEMSFDTLSIMTNLPMLTEMVMRPMVKTRARLILSRREGNLTSLIKGKGNKKSRRKGVSISGC